MKTGLAGVVVSGVCAMTAALHAQVTIYTDEASFLAATQPGVYLEGFTSVVQGPSDALDFGPVNGFSFTVDSETPGMLFNGGGFISTNNSNEALIVTFTGNDVTAVGGNFWSTDQFFEAFGADVLITLSDGTSHTFFASGPSDFRGFTSDTAITSISIEAQSDFDAVWSTLDNLRVGAAIPAPSGLAALLAPAALLARRRR